MNNFLLIIATILVLVFTALFAVPPMINWNDFRGAFEEEASRLLDREVRVQGEVSVRILPVPYVSFEKVRIADAPGIAGSFASADQFKLWLSVPPLLRGVFEARKIELERPMVRLRTEPDGSGNWRKLQISRGNLAYIPANVALNSVRITDATVLVEAPGGEEITKLDNISGEMTAGALTGPYKFIGTIPLGQAGPSQQSAPNQPDAERPGEPYEVRLSTAPVDDAGRVRFNASVRTLDNRLSHTINGTLHDLLGKARAEGQLTSRSTRRPAGKSPARRMADYDMTADVKLDATALRLDKIAVSFANKDRQQSLNGQAVTSWRTGVVTETTLRAGWLDLGAIAGLTADEGPLLAVERLLGEGLGVFGAGVTRVNVAIDQANLAGAPVSDIAARLVRRDGVTKVEALRASLPGRSSLAIDGFLESRPAGLQFDGNLLMQSASFAELAEWLHNGQKASLSPELKARLAASFALTANIRIRPQSILLADARARLGDTGAEGGIGFDWSARPVLTASIDAGTLALEKFGANLLAPSGLARLLGLPDSGLSQSPTEPADNFAWARDMDVTLGLRAHRITDGNRSFSDVDIDITRSGGDLLINKLDLTWTPGLELALAGQLTGLQHVPSGRITGTVAAATPVAGANLARLLSLAAGRDVPASLVDERTPLRVAVDLELGRAPSAGAPSVTSSRFRADGTLGRDRIRIEAETAGGLGGWLEQPAEITARMTGIDALATARWLLGPPVGAPAAPPAAAASVPLSASASRDVAATVVMTAVGIPAKSMKSYLRMAAGDLIDADLTSNLRLSGVGNNGPLIASWSGALNLRRMTAATLASLTWPALRAHVPDLPVTGRIAIDRTGAGITLKPQRITMGPSVIGGDLRLTRATAGAAAELEGQLTVTETSLSALASLILAPTADQDAAPGEASKSPGDATRAPSEAPEIAAKSSSAIWPSTQFSLDHLAGVTSNISIRIGALDWGPPGAALEGVALRIATTPSTVRISDFSARLGPASLTATAEVERGKAGAKITLDLTGRDIALERFAPERAREKRLAGTAAIELKLEGEALSPRSLSTLIQGSGVIRLKNAIVPGMTTEDATAAARAVIDGRVAIDALSSEMVVLAAKGQVTLGSPTLKLRIANGRADFPAIVFQQDEGALRNTTFVDIRRWQIDSQWIVTPARQPRPDTPGETVALPPVTIDYEGSLAATGAIVPKINLGDLERELVVRQMEANVARLERLRREDEARAAADEQRRRRIEDEQRRSIEEENRRRLGEPTATGEPLRPPEPARAIPPPSEARRSREGTQAPVNR